MLAETVDRIAVASEHCNRLAHDGAPANGQCDHAGFCPFCSASDRDAKLLDAPPAASVIGILAPEDETPDQPPTPAELARFASVDLTPTDAMAAEAKRGLEWREKFNRGGTAVGVARARDISNKASLSPDTVRRMVSYFARHEVDKQGTGFSPGEDGYPSAGRIAWALWGGDAGASWALGKASRALGKNKQSVQERQASVLQLTLGEVPREMVFGHTTTGGSLIDAFNHGGQYGTDYVTRVIALADHAVDALLGYYVDDQYVAFSANGTQAGFGGTLSIEFRNASGSAVSLPSVASAGGWGASDKLIGVTHVWVTYKFDDKVWTQGHPQFRWNLRGLRVYDPRKDAALGYTGEAPHVWSDRTTHEFTQNAALIRYAYTRGIYVEGRQGEADQLLVGRGLSAEEAPPERVIAAANLCDEVPAEGELRYTAAGQALQTQQANTPAAQIARADKRAAAVGDVCLQGF